MRANWASGLLLLLAATAGLSRPVSASGLSVQAGLGYDLLSQEYFLDSATAAGPDSLIVNWALTTDYLDDLKGQLWLTYSPLADGSLELRGRYDQTAEFVRVRLGGDLSTNWQQRRLQLFGEVELKDRYHGESEFGDSYLRGYARGKLSQPLSQSLKLSLQLKTDGVQFASASTYSYNHFRLGGDISLQKLFGGFSSGDIRLTITHRRVPDSVQLNYLAVGAEAGLLAFYDRGELDLVAGLVKKDYSQEDHKDDHYRLLFEANHRFRLGRGWFSRQRLETELTLYHPDDPINVDYSEAGLALLGGIESGPYSLAVGPVFRFLDERKSEFSTGEDYAETGLQITLDCLTPGRLFASAESTLGRRNLKTESDLQTDFSFERLSLIGDLSITATLYLSLLFSAEWEWHDRPEENSRMYLLSSNLTYSF